MYFVSRAVAFLGVEERDMRLLVCETVVWVEVLGFRALWIGADGLAVETRVWRSFWMADISSVSLGSKRSRSSSRRRESVSEDALSSESIVSSNRGVLMRSPSIALMYSSVKVVEGAFDRAMTDKSFRKLSIAKQSSRIALEPETVALDASLNVISSSSSNDVIVNVSEAASSISVCLCVLSDLDY